MNKQPKKESRIPAGKVFTESMIATLVSPGDCFGSFDASVADCHGCHDQYACAMFQQFNLKQQVATVEKEQGPFLDQTKFPTEEEMNEIITPGKTYNEILEAFKQKAFCPDEQTLELHLQSAIRSRDLRFKAGVLC